MSIERANARPSHDPGDDAAAGTLTPADIVAAIERVVTPPVALTEAA